MTSKPIAVGDLVQVVRDCCGIHLGQVALVAEISNCGTSCAKCGWKCFGKPAARLAELATDKTRNTGWHLLSDLKRIPPMSELEGERTEEKLREPA